MSDQAAPVSSLFVEMEDGYFFKILTRDVFYCETVKGRHYCRLVHRGGDHLIHADLKTLARRLGTAFFLCSASTLVNFEAVERVNLQEHRLCFPGGACCFFSRAYAKRIRALVLLDG